MSSELRLRRGSSAATAVFTGAQGETTFNTTNNALVSHDGVKQGGYPGGGFRQRGATFNRSVFDKFAEIVSVSDFGAIGDGATDAAPPTQAAVNYLFSTNGNMLFFPDGVFHFESTVTVLFDTPRSLRITGTSSAGFTGVRPGGTRITGKSGLDTLFLLTNSNPAAGGAFGFECDHIDFNGGGATVGTAIKSVLGGMPARPYSVHNCQFNEFQKALVSDISSGTINDTGIANASITENEFQGNTIALYGKGKGSWMDMAFQRNVCEQNSAGIFIDGAGGGYMGGTCIISDNLLEGQNDAIIIIGGLLSVEISRNYFEANGGSIMTVACSNGNSTCTVKDNFILSPTAGAYASFSNLVLDCEQNFDTSGVKFRCNYLQDSRIKNAGKVDFNGGASTSITLTLDSVSLLTNAPSGLTAGTYVTVASSQQQTPAGKLGVLNLTGYGSLLPVSTSVATGDVIVAMALVRCKNADDGNIFLTLYNNASGYIGNSEASAGLGNVGKDNWRFVMRSVTATGPSTGTTYIRWGTNTSNMEITDTYVYKIPAASLSSEMPLFMPSPAVTDKYLTDIEKLYGKNYAQTSTTSGVSIVDTGIFSNTAEIGYGGGAVYDVFIEGDQNAGGNSAKNVIVGNIVIGTGYNGTTHVQYINYADVLNPAMGATPKFTISTVFWNGSTESATAIGTTSQIRIKVSGYQAGYEGFNQFVRLVKRI